MVGIQSGTFRVQARIKFRTVSRLLIDEHRTFVIRYVRLRACNVCKALTRVLILLAVTAQSGPIEWPPNLPKSCLSKRGITIDYEQSYFRFFKDSK